MWKKGKLRVEVGIIYQDGSYIPILGRPSTGYHLGEKMPVELLIQNKPNFWFYYSIISRQIIDRFILITGNGGLEGEGFVAFLDQNEVPIWIIHFDDSEPLEIKSFTDHKVVVVGDDGYRFNEFVIQLDQPELFTCSQKLMD